MYSRGRNIFGMLMVAFIFSIAALIFFRKKREQPVYQLSVRGLKKGGRLVKAGTRGVVNSAKHGLKVLSK